MLLSAPLEIPVRWYVEKRERWQWWNLADDYVKQVDESQPRLQYQKSDGTWHDVPTTTVIFTAGEKPK